MKEEPTTTQRKSCGKGWKDVVVISDSDQGSDEEATQAKEETMKREVKREIKEELPETMLVEQHQVIREIYSESEDCQTPSYEICEETQNDSTDREPKRGKAQSSQKR